MKPLNEHEEEIPEETGQRLGPYELLRPLYKDTQGEVFEANDTERGRHVTIRVFPAHLFSDPKSVDRLRKAAKTLSQVRHPNIAATYAVGQDRERFYLVTEWIDAPPLAQFLGDGPIPAARVLRWLKGLLQGLAAVHERGIVHRNIKPTSIYVVKGEVLKLADFGFSRMEGNAPSGGTTKGLWVGDVDYVPPETFSAGTSGPTGDIYSLGVILFELLTGTPAFDEPNPLLKVNRITKRGVPSPRSVAPSVPAELDKIVLKMCHRDPSQRPSSAEEAVRLLAEAKLQ